MRVRYILLTIFFLAFSSCSGLGDKRSQKSDEFLIEKKNPLVMPPDIKELPEPSNNKQDVQQDDNFKATISSGSTEKKSNADQNTTLQESIIKKIEE